MRSITAYFVVLLVLLAVMPSVAGAMGPEEVVDIFTGTGDTESVQELLFVIVLPFLILFSIFLSSLRALGTIQRPADAVIAIVLGLFGVRGVAPTVETVLYEMNFLPNTGIAVSAAGVILVLLLLIIFQKFGPQYVGAALLGLILLALWLPTKGIFTSLDIGHIDPNPELILLPLILIAVLLLSRWLSKSS